MILEYKIEIFKWSSKPERYFKKKKKVSKVFGRMGLLFFSSFLRAKLDYLTNFKRFIIDTFQSLRSKLTNTLNVKT